MFQIVVRRTGTHEKVAIATGFESLCGSMASEVATAFRRQYVKHNRHYMSFEPMPGQTPAWMMPAVVPEQVQS